MNGQRALGHETAPLPVCVLCKRSYDFPEFPDGYRICLDCRGPSRRTRYGTEEIEVKRGGGFWSFIGRLAERIIVALVEKKVRK